MNILPIIFSLLFAANILAQSGALAITNLETQKVRVIKENKRIRINTTNGEKLQGRFSILDENTIALDGRNITLNEIVVIRRHPLFNTIFIKTNLIHIGALSLFFGVLGTALSTGLSEDGIERYAPLAGGVSLLAAGIYGAYKSPNLNKGFRIDQNWSFKIQMNP